MLTLSIKDVVKSSFNCSTCGGGGVGVGSGVGLGGSGGSGTLTPSIYLLGLVLVLISPFQLVVAFSFWEKIDELGFHSECSDVKVKLG